MCPCAGSRGLTLNNPLPPTIGTSAVVRPQLYKKRLKPVPLQMHPSKSLLHNADKAVPSNCSQCQRLAESNGATSSKLLAASPRRQPPRGDAATCRAQLHSRHPTATSTPGIRQQPSGLADTLDRFWLARGVVDPAQRQQLVDVEGALVPDAGFPSAGGGSAVPGLAATWAPLEGAAAAQVAAVSHRIAALRQLLGGKDDVDVVWMVVREPQLLTADMAAITQRLLQLRTSRAAEGLDVVKLAEAQPGLLLQASGIESGDGEEEESAAQQQLAWEHGLLGDGKEEWARRLRQLRDYWERYGDAHVGCRDGDDPELRRWAAKQRSSHSTGTLETGRQALLEAAGFEFDEERAEWLRWFNEIAAFQAASGHCSPVPLAAGSDFLLLNWCAVQRIARRSRRLAPDREALLEGIGFDWAGADPLS